MENIKKAMNQNIIISLITFFLGLFIFLKPDTTIKSIAIVIGILLIIMGSGPIIDIIRSSERKISFSIAPSIILFIIAFILFFSPELLVSIIPVLIGVALVMSSAYKLQSIYNFKKANNLFNTWNLIITLCILVLGLLLIINPFDGALAITEVIGIFLMLYAILDITDSVLLKRMTKIVK